MPKVLHMQQKQPENLEKPAPMLRRILPDAEEEHAAVATINKWVALGDAALSDDRPTRKVA